MLTRLVLAVQCCAAWLGSAHLHTIDHLAQQLTRLQPLTEKPLTLIRRLTLFRRIRSSHRSDPCSRLGHSMLSCDFLVCLQRAA